MKSHFCLWRLIATATGLDESARSSPKWQRHLSRCPQCAREHAEQKAVALQLSASAGRIQLPQIDAVRLTKVAISQRHDPWRCIWKCQHPVGLAGLAALLILLVFIMPQLHKQNVKPAHREIRTAASVGGEFIKSAMVWTEGMLSGAMLEAELRLLIRDAKTLTSVMADEISAPFNGIIPL